MDMSPDTGRNKTSYVVCDHRATSLLGWLSRWTADGGVIASTGVPLNLYSRDFPPGRIVPGGNRTSGAAGAESNYVVVIKSK